MCERVSASADLKVVVLKCYLGLCRRCVALSAFFWPGRLAEKQPILAEDTIESGSDDNRFLFQVFEIK